MAATMLARGGGGRQLVDVDRAKVKITLYFNFMRQCTVRRRVGRFMTKFAYKQRLIKCRAKHLLSLSLLLRALKTKNYFGKCLPKLIAYTQRAPSKFIGALCRRLRCWFFLFLLHLLLLSLTLSFAGNLFC